MAKRTVDEIIEALGVKPVRMMQITETGENGEVVSIVDSACFSCEDGLAIIQEIVKEDSDA